MGDSKRGELEIVRQKNKVTVVFGIDKTHAPERIWIVFERVGSSNNNGLIRRDSSAGRYSVGIAAVENNSSFSARDKESAAAMKGVQAFEVKVGAVHDVRRAGLGDDLVEQMHIVPFSIRNLNERGDGAAQVQKSVRLHRGYIPAKMRPRKTERQRSMVVESRA